MDTLTHVTMGFALGALATLDPTVSQSPELAQTILCGTVIGSLVPDFDTILKLKNNAVYIRNHRGITHSIPAVFLWSFLITIISHFFFNENIFYLWSWTFLAVAFHVFVDIFNAYGTQALRPFTKKWVALGMINTFDPLIFFIHIAGLILWGIGFDAGYTFLTIYIVLIGYYIVRFLQQQAIRKKILKLFPDTEKIVLSPTITFQKWHLAITTSKKFHVAKSINGDIRILDTFDRVAVPETDVILAAKKDDNLSAFLSFSPVYRFEVEEYNDYFEVRFTDLRYRSKSFYPFVAVVQLDKNLTIISSYTGWIFSEGKLRKKLALKLV